jgi:hypothetical protein
MQNYIGDLQHRCQKERIDLPKYETIKRQVKMDDGSFTSQFECILYVNNQVLEGNMGFNKKEAEQNAAAKYLSMWKKPLIQGNFVVLIDLESINNIDDYDWKVQGMISYRSSPFFRFPSQGRFVEIQSTKKDACDIAIICSAYQMAKEGKRVVVVTKDHFGDTLADLVDNIDWVRDLKDLVVKKNV